MSQENVELVGRTMDTYNARDLPAYLDTLSESVRFQSRFTAMDRVVYRGHDGLRRYFAELDVVWSRYEMRVRRLVPAGHQVAALCHLYAVGRESGLLVEEDSAVVFTLEAGKIVRIDAYPTHAEALDAVGLREQAMSKENVEVVRSLYGLGGDAFLNPRADAADRAFRDHLGEQFEVRLPSDYPEGEPVFRGRAGLEEMFAMLADTWGKWRFELDRFVDAGERVVVFVRILAEGGASGVPIERETTHVWTIRGGRAVSMHVYRDRSQALEAVGLRE